MATKAEHDRWTMWRQTEAAYKPTSSFWTANEAVAERRMSDVSRAISEIGLLVKDSPELYPLIKDLGHRIGPIWAEFGNVASRRAHEAIEAEVEQLCQAQPTTQPPGSESDTE